MQTNRSGIAAVRSYRGKPEPIGEPVLKLLDRGCNPARSMQEDDERRLPGDSWRRSWHAFPALSSDERGRQHEICVVPGDRKVGRIGDEHCSFDLARLPGSRGSHGGDCQKECQKSGAQAVFHCLRIFAQ